MNGSRRPYGLLAASSLVYTFLYLPILVLMLYSFNGTGVVGFPPRDLTFAWYVTLFHDEAMWSAVGNSVVVALASVGLAIIIGFAAAHVLDRFHFPGKALFRRLILLPLIVPGIVTGISLLLLIVSSGVRLSLVTVILGHATALTAVAITELAAGLQRIDPALEEASTDLGAGAWYTFTRVTLPLMKSSLLGTALLVFTLSMDEIAVTFFLIGRQNTLPLEIWSRLRRGATPEMNAVSTLIILFSLVTIVIWQKCVAGDKREPQAVHV